MTDAKKFRLGLAESAVFSPEALRQARLRAGYTQREIAETLGCKLDNVRLWEHGERTERGLPARYLIKLMIAYQIEAQDLVRIK